MASLWPLPARQARQWRVRSNLRAIPALLVRL